MPNWPIFLERVSRYVPSTTTVSAAKESDSSTSASPMADEPTPRTDENSKRAHQDLLKKACLGATTAAADV
ncbi:hypothetical protein [Bythopirellula goksoeyrii]|uniref:hypothetical protein n=1 Tax=Bythopirellula goksoeyrii TaxID=1400387 RepID=UPI0011CE1A61|nr:hypothetical protein [Bythopirellula goksoeyrii]